MRPRCRDGRRADLRTGTLLQVRGGHTLEEAFAQLVGAGAPGRGCRGIAADRPAPHRHPPPAPAHRQGLADRRRPARARLGGGNADARDRPLRQPGRRHRRPRPALRAVAGRPLRTDRARGRRRHPAPRTFRAARRAPPAPGVGAAGRWPAGSRAGIAGDRAGRADRLRRAGGSGRRAGGRRRSPAVAAAGRCPLNPGRRVLAPGSRRGRDAGTIVTATGISLLAVAGHWPPR